MTSNQEHIEKVGELLQQHRIAMVTTMNAEGHHEARPLTVQEREFDGDLWFIVALDSPAIAQIRSEPRVGVSFSGNGSWLSISGTAEVVDDQAKLEQLWSPGVEAWFPNGPGDPNAGLLRIDSHSAEYWDTPGGSVSTVFSLVKSKLTGERLQGENEKVEL